MNDYNEQEAAATIKTRLAEAGISDVTDADIQHAVTLIWDAYDDLGMLDADFDENDDTEDAELAAVAEYLCCHYAGSTPLSRQAIKLIVKAELDYEDSLI